MTQEADLTAPEAKRMMAARLHEDHGETINAYPDLRCEFGVSYRNMDELPMRQFRGGISASSPSSGDAPV